MQLSKEQHIKVDFAIERYLDEREQNNYYIASQNTKKINNYLNVLSISQRELLITVYFNLSRVPSEEEKIILEKHKVNIFNLLIGKTKIEYTTKYFVNTDKISKLNRYKRLVSKLKSLQKRLEVLQAKKEDNYNINAVDYSKPKVTFSNSKYGLNSLNIISDIHELEKEIQHCKLELQNERNYLVNEFKNLSLSTTKQIFYLRYILLKDWEYISNHLNISVANCFRQHDMYISELNL